MKLEHKIFEAEIKEANEKDLTVVHFISTEKKDRGGDIMRADGMKIKGKPVVLLAHGFSQMGTEPVAKPVWIRKGEFKGSKGLMAKTQFFDDDTGRRLWAKTSGGFMPNWSIGYIPLKYQDVKDGRDISEWELLEYSPVGVPMNPDAQSLALEGFSFKMMPEDEDQHGELTAWKDADGQWEEKPYPNEHACRLNDPDKYIRIRRQNDKFGDGIHAIWGVQEGDKPVELQAIRFSSDKFTADEAKSWLKSHDYKCKMFEAATGKEVEAEPVKENKEKKSEQEINLEIEGKDNFEKLIDEKLAPLMEAVIQLNTKLETLIPSVKPDTQGKDNGDNGTNTQEPARLVFTDKKADEAKKKQQQIDLIRSLVTEAVNEKAKKMIDEMKGKVY